MGASGKMIDNPQGINHAYALNGINGDYAQSRIPEHAAAQGR
jgi:hypothetical protein